MKSDAKFKGKLSRHASSRKPENLHLDWLLLSKAFKDLNEKVQSSCLMTLKSNEKFEEKLTPGSENDMKNLANFNASSGKSENLHFDVLLLSISYNVAAKKEQ